MNYDTLIEELTGKFGQEILTVERDADIPTLTVSATVVKTLIAWLKEVKKFIFLTDLCGIHYPEQEKELGVVYHLHNLTANKRLRIKCFVAKKRPQIDSLVTIFAGANWMERETFDFYGIEFTGHPNLKRILNVEYMDYHPLRKEYPLEDATRTDKDDRFFGR